MPTGRLHIAEPALERAGPDLWRVSAAVEGAEVFFESSIPLAPRRESFVSAFLLPAMARGADLELGGPLDEGFACHLDFVRGRAREWWSFSAGDVHVPLAERAPAAVRAADSGLFYTGGADSSYALQQLQGSVRYAIFAEGFDIRLDDRPRLEKARAWLAGTTRACGVELVSMRTNLRLHPVFRSVSWEITHGAALAALAHALTPSVHTMYVAASDVEPPWGSVPDLDAAWSSDSVKIENFGSDLTRLQRVAAIARWAPVRGRLRVCWENKSSDLNCGSCEKCVRTRLQLLASGAPDGLGSFPPVPLRPSMWRLGPLAHELHGQWRQIGASLEDPVLRREIGRLLRGKRPPLWWRSLQRARRGARRAAGRVSRSVAWA